MSDYLWFPLGTGSTPYTWNGVGDWTDGAYWVNLSDLSMGAVPGAADSVYIVAGNSLFSPPSPLPAPPYPVTIDLDAGDVKIADLSMAGFGLFTAPLQPTLAISGDSLDVTGSIGDNFTGNFPEPIGTAMFSGGGTITLASAAGLEIGTTVDPHIVVDFLDATADRLTLDGVSASDATAFGGLIEGFGLDNVIALTDVAFGGLTKNYAGGVLTVSLGTTTVAALAMTGDYTTNSFRLMDDNGHTDIVMVCFATGTHIATAHGETAVEQLRVGDTVVCLEAGQRVLRPVRWIGQRHVDLTAHPQPDQAAPIRVRRDAFAEAMPHRDLVLSPDHCLFVDGALIPVRLLVNGMTVLQDRQAQSVQYWHVELDRHGVLLAEGLPAESYLDTGNRSFFRDAGPALTLHPAFRVAADHARWKTDACAPLTVDEASVRPVWQRLAARAAALGHAPPPMPAPAPAPNDPDVHLLVDGRRVRPISAGADRYVFAMPPGARRMHLVSPAARPSDRAPWLNDRRRLGLPVTRIVLRAGGEETVIPPDHPALQDGWHATEQDGAALWRWTDGQAAVPLPPRATALIAELHIRDAASPPAEAALRPAA
jgi:hypothetical protein